MSDFEQRIRDSLRRADTVVVPVEPLDPDEIAARASVRSLGGGRQWLVMVAVVVLAVGVGLGALALRGSGDTVTATPAAPATSPTDEGASVEVDVYSGRDNPHVALDAKVAQELYAMLADQEAAGLLHKTGAPDLSLGFRGFVLTPADSSLRELRILPTRVVVHGTTDYQQLHDPEQQFYNRVYDAIGPLLAEDVRRALPATKPEIPDVTATVPPSKGATATWVLAAPRSVSVTSDRLQLRVTRLECASGKTGQILEPVVSLGTDDIVIRTDAEPLSDGAQTCQGNDSVTVTVTLLEPIGSRSLVDAACLAGEAVRTSSCATGALRWSP